MLSSIFLLCASPKQAPLVAFAARFYSPAPHERTYQQVYLCDLQGKHRKQLSFDHSDKSDVRWIGTRKLAWIQGSKALVEFNLDSRKEHVVTRGFIYANEDWHERTQYRRGEAIYVQIPKPTTCDPPSEDSAAKIYAVVHDRLEAVTSAPAPLYSAEKNAEAADLWQAARMSVGYKIAGSQAMIHLRDSTATCSGPAFQLSYRGNSHSFNIPNPDFVWPSKKNPGACWVRTASFASSAGSDIWIYSINLKTGKTKLVADDVLDVDFEADQPYWASSNNDKRTAQLGKRRVWARDLWVGDVRTGEQWRIASGPVYGQCARIQPQ